MNLKDQVAIITGAGGALGRGTALVLARAGAAIVVAEERADRGREAAEAVRQAGGRALFVRTDVSSASSVKAMVARAVRELGGVDVLVNNAAIYPSRPWTEIREKEWDRVFAVNIKGYYLCARACYPYFQARGRGKIINISSITFYLGFAKLLDYVSTKGAVVGFTRALAREVGPGNICVNCIAPGAFPTDAEKIHPDPKGYNRWVLEQQSTKRRGTAEDIGHAVLFLASRESDFITGQTLMVDGGWSMK
ncbi:MAG: glucose 1-dehydrogenase [Planctomycetes bacterium]|nr:glucose 1-dehydrogenase [Planctomycetota bacterium]